MSPTNDMKARLFVDMDGTLAVWKQAACFEDLLQPGYFRDLPPYQTVLDAVKILCNTKPELDVYALSAYMPENPYAVHEKNAWLDAYLPEIDSEHRIFVACGGSKARAAANRLKTPCIDSSFVLSIALGILQEMNGGVVIYHEASKEDPENLPAGWYIDDKDYTTFSIANDPEAVKCLKAPLKKGGYSFEERKAFWDSFFDFMAPKLRLPVKIAKRSGCKL